MNYEEAINYIEGRAIFGSRPGFERINALLDALGHPEKGIKYVHIAGTNGKGSVCTTTANILSSAGYKTGLFTSPFVSDFRERIMLDGEFIPKDTLCSICERVKEITDKLDAEDNSPTEFEVITAIAFLFYKSVQCDLVVLEVGLGGLLDSTNVIDTPLVSAIVSLSFDHMGVLGDTIEEIAAQKAGIIKDGGVTISAPHQPASALKVLEDTAKQHKNEFIVADPTEIEEIHEDINGNLIKVDGQEILLPLLGPHQIDNLSVTLAIINALKKQGFNISSSAIKAGIEKTTIPARVEVLSKDPLVILDGGHNEDGAHALAKTIEQYINQDITLVIGVMADKEVDAVLGHLVPLAKRVVTTTPSNPRAMSADELAAKAKAFCSEITAESDPCKAFDLARSLTDDKEALIVCGSLYLAGDVRAHMVDTLGK
ncbi:MAG: folylpolyglutamate synthase/dihydrofolate synthase family protein [Clostridia bacterium]|nr:folylpolyglutamate synthase/dihydrofolate synthase family protein [Clostridia bacterium]